MEIFVNECSFHGQYQSLSDAEEGFKIFYRILDRVGSLGNVYRFFNRKDAFSGYQVVVDATVTASIYNLKDKSFARAIFLLLKDRLKVTDWRTEQQHSKDDSFVCEGDDVVDTSLAELTHRKLADDTLVELLINFPLSKFSGVSSSKVTRNGDEICELRCVEDEAGILAWIAGNQEIVPFDFDGGIPPTDAQTILIKANRFERTGRFNGGRWMYREISTGYYWYVDSLHSSNAHIEVFDRAGDHVGEASLMGELDYTKKDSNKDIDI